MVFKCLLSAEDYFSYPKQKALHVQVVMLGPLLFPCKCEGTCIYMYVHVTSMPNALILHFLCRCL